MHIDSIYRRPYWKGNMKGSGDAQEIYVADTVSLMRGEGAT